jgi:hypothetical protein
MGRAKDIVLKVIPSKAANEFVKRYHYSGKVVQNSTLHLGAFLNGKLGGVMQYGNPIDKRKVLPLVSTDNKSINAKWNEMLELNRMAFSPILPRNSESRCISVSIRLIRKHAPQVKWILSFADGTQCGDGTIYRASGFHLTQLVRNKTLLEYNGHIVADKTLNNTNYKQAGMSAGKLKKMGAKPLAGFQLRYIYLISPDAKLAVPSIPFSKIQEMGASMYKGKLAREA